MTDKDTIINRVDVSGCEFLITSNDKQLCRCIKSDLFGGIEFVKNAKNGNCKDNPNCYYKQLKRTEALCEEMFVKYTDLEMKYKHKEQECEELKKEQAEIKKYLGISHKTILERLEELTDFRDMDREELDQLKAELEQEKALKETYLACYKTKHEELADKYETLKARCKSLEEISGRLQEQNHDLTLENEKLEVWKSITPLGVKKLVQLLNKIKEIAEKAAKCLYTTESDDYTDGYRWLGSLILQKISEVIGDEK